MSKHRICSIDVSLMGADDNGGIHFGIKIKKTPHMSSALHDVSATEILEFNAQLTRAISHAISVSFTPTTGLKKRSGRYAWMKPGATGRYATFDDESNLFCTRVCEIVSGDLRKSTDGRLCVQVRNDQNKTVWVSCAGLERVNG